MQKAFTERRTGREKGDREREERERRVVLGEERWGDGVQLTRECPHLAVQIHEIPLQVMRKHLILVKAVKKRKKSAKEKSSEKQRTPPVGKRLTPEFTRSHSQLKKRFRQLWAGTSAVQRRIHHAVVSDERRVQADLQEASKES